MFTQYLTIYKVGSNMTKKINMEEFITFNNQLKILDFIKDQIGAGFKEMTPPAQTAVDNFFNFCTNLLRQYYFYEIFNSNFNRLSKNSPKIKAIEAQL